MLRIPAVEEYQSVDKPNVTSQVSFCPHCGNTAPQSLLITHSVQISSHRVEVFTVAKCETCHEPLIYFGEMRKAEKTIQQGAFYYGLDERALLYPRPNDLHKCVPTRILKLFRDASIIKWKAPSAFASQMRRCLEIICNDRGAAKNTLKEKLEELHRKGDIPISLTQMTDLIRLLGNIASHDDIVEVSDDYVDTIEHFIRAIIDCVYVHPFKITEIQEKIAQAKKAK
jgi:hypothetical protein